jgi:hypothetical protein
MKKLTSVFVIAVLLSSFLNALANPKTKKDHRLSIAPARGFWVIKETPANKQLVTVLYYNNENHVVRKETRSKRFTNISRKKVLRSLNRSLEEAIDWCKPI